MKYTQYQYEQMFEAALATSRAMLIPWYLMLSYLYYCRDISLLSDGRYDKLCQELDAEWDCVTHVHKHVIQRDGLKAGTAFGLKAEDYPSLVTHAATHLAGVPWIDHRGVTETAASTLARPKISFTVKKKEPASEPKKTLLSFGRRS